MRCLLPTPSENLDRLALADLYAWPTGNAGRGHVPWVRANFAASADGAARGPGGLSRSVSSSADRQVFALQRATCDAVLVGAGTARAENYGPVLVRDELSDLRASQGRLAPPTLVVVSGRANLDPGSKIFSRPSPRTIVITPGNSPVESRAALAEVADVHVCGEDSVDLPTMLELLGQRGLLRVLCEGGPH
ncbi:MAG: dihydrofolate reductase family protein, partial [Actinomycetes bacterium]